LPDFFTIFLLSIQRFRPTTDFGEFPLAHDSIPQLILEKPQVILDTHILQADAYDDKRPPSENPWEVFFDQLFGFAFRFAL